MTIRTSRCSGAGNTFHIAFGYAEDFKSPDSSREAMRAVAKKICSQDKADGFIFLDSADRTAKPESTQEFVWNFFNNDGSDAEMCGNATRCIGLFLGNSLKSEQQEWMLETVRGAVVIKKISENVFKVKMPAVKKELSDLGFYCDTGVPHLVLESKFKDLFNALSAEFRASSSMLRHHPSFGSRGTNVTYVENSSEASKIRAISFERGVEDFTRACGTGAVAAAYFNLAKRGIVETQVEMPGGTLTINLQNVAIPEMTGPAVLLEKHEYEIEI